MILTGLQIREGRDLAGMSQADLAAAAGVASALVTRAESTNGAPLMRRFDNRAIRRALEALGVEFIAEDGGGAGVRLRKGEA